MKCWFGRGIIVLRNTNDYKNEITSDFYAFNYFEEINFLMFQDECEILRQKNVSYVWFEINDVVSLWM